MQTPQPNTTSPLPAFYGELTERFHKEPVTKIAKSMGISYKKLWYHANKLGLRKERPNGYKSHARKLVMESFHDHSLTELAKIAGVSHTTGNHHPGTGSQAYSCRDQGNTLTPPQGGN